MVSKSSGDGAGGGRRSVGERANILLFGRPGGGNKSSVQHRAGLVRMDGARCSPALPICATATRRFGVGSGKHHRQVTDKI